MIQKKALWLAMLVIVAIAVATPKVLPMLGGPGSASGGKNDRKSGGGARSSAPLKVSSIVVQAAPLAEVVTSTGTLRAEESVELQAEINGKIVAINLTEGTRVRKGDLLVKFNDADLRAMHARATHRKHLATLRESRMELLFKEGIANQEDYDTALSELEVQDAEINLIEAQIAKTEIRAPFDGIVGLRFVSEGAFVNAATRIATFQRLENLKIDFSIPEKYTGRIRVGSAVTFTIAGGDRSFGGEIYAFDPKIDPVTRTVLIRALCPNQEQRLLPGAFANVEFTLAEMDNAILVPSVAVIPGLSEMTVFVLKEGKAERRTIEIGTRTESTVQILAGLKPGEVVLTSGLQQLRSGQAVATDAIAAKPPPEPSERTSRPNPAKPRLPSARKPLREFQISRAE
jgi:membrane fusion protein, multidrug efflux system